MYNPRVLELVNTKNISLARYLSCTINRNRAIAILYFMGFICEQQRIVLETRRNTGNRNISSVYLATLSATTISNVNLQKCVQYDFNRSTVC